MKRKCSVNYLSVNRFIILFMLLNLFTTEVRCDDDNEVNEVNEATDSNVGEPIFLTPHVDSGHFEAAKTASEVNSSYFLGEKSHAGFITVDKELNSNTWFWYFPVQGGKVENAPLIIWLQGGPGVSSLYSLFQGIGPFRYQENTLIRNPDSWHSRHSILFIDNPIGSGFSFTDKTEGYCNNQTQISVNLYEFLQQFYQIFPELQPIPMFLVGQSYAGKHIPYFAYEIHTRNPTGKIKINLQGMAIGNGWIDPPNLYQTSALAFQIGLLDIRQEREVRVLENAVRLEIEAGNWKTALQVRQAIVSYVSEAANLSSLFNYMSDEPCFDDPPYGDFMTSDAIRDAVHVGNSTYQWLSLHANIHLMGDNMVSAKPLLEILLEHYPILMYNGQLDLVVAYPNLEKIYNSLNWTGAENYRNAKRAPWLYDGKLVGYEKHAGKLHEVMFRNAGHCVAMEKPELLNVKIAEFTYANSHFIKSNEIEDTVVDENENSIDSGTPGSDRRR